MILHLPVETLHARAALRTEVVRAAPGKPFLAAVEIVTDPHWHVYWRNPGDSGVPTRIAWSAPKGWRVEPLEYPVPERFAPGGITAYGYEGKTFFLARVTPSRMPGTLAASVKWLVCSNACIQGAATVKAKIPMGAKAVASPTAARLRMERAQLPRPATGWTVRATKGKRVVLAVDLGRQLLVTKGWRAPEFFPAESGVVDQAKPLLATLQGNGFVFKMNASPFPEKRERLAGVIVYGNVGSRRAMFVNPRLEPGESR
jgi:thiol:disulfide interchange protein DsbD